MWGDQKTFQGTGVEPKGKLPGPPPAMKNSNSQRRSSVNLHNKLRDHFEGRIPGSPKFGGFKKKILSTLIFELYSTL